MSETGSADPFIERAYEETYELLIVMRDYLSGSMRDEARELDNGDQLQLTYHLSRVTRQLTDVMAWLMLQKAVAAGELTSREAAGEPSAELDSLEDAGDEIDPEAVARLPLAARGIIDRARRLCALVGQLRDSAGETGTA